METIEQIWSEDVAIDEVTEILAECSDEEIYEFAFYWLMYTRQFTHMYMGLDKESLKREALRG